MDWDWVCQIDEDISNCKSMEIRVNHAMDTALVCPYRCLTATSLCDRSVYISSCAA